MPLHRDWELYGFFWRSYASIWTLCSCSTNAVSGILLVHDLDFGLSGQKHSSTLGTYKCRLLFLLIFLMSRNKLNNAYDNLIHVDKNVVKWSYGNLLPTEDCLNLIERTLYAHIFDDKLVFIFYCKLDWHTKSILSLISAARIVNLMMNSCAYSSPSLDVKI